MFTKLLLNGCVFALIVGTAFADESNITFVPIKPLPAVQNPNPRPVVEHNIRLIQSIGVVARVINDEEILVDESIFRFAPDIKFYSKTYQPLSQKDITKGCVIGWRLDDNGLIYKMWKLADSVEQNK